METTSPRHSLREMPWIPVRYIDGTLRDIGLDQLYADAHLIRTFAIPNSSERAGVFRFLIGATALICRAHGDVDWEDIAEAGFDAAAVKKALDAIDNHLWLVHPDTPFMQDNTIISAASSIAPLEPTSPGGSSKTWWGRPGGPFTPESFAPPQAARLLTASWFYTPTSPNAKGVYADAPEVSWPPRGMASKGSAGMRAFRVGHNLSHTLLANVLPEWVEGADMPLWTISGPAAPVGSLTLATWSGRVFLLEGTDLFTGFRFAGRRIKGMTKPDKAALKDLESSLWPHDATVMRKTSPKKKDAETTTLQPLAPGATAMEYITNWHLINAERAGAQPLAPALVPYHLVEFLVLRVDGGPTDPRVSEISWLNVDERILDPRRFEVLRALATTIDRHRHAVRTAVGKALGSDVQKALDPWSGFSSLFHAFASNAEQVLSRIISSEGTGVTADDVRALSDAAMDTYVEAVSPFVTPLTVEGVARARAGLRIALAGIQKEYTA